MFDCRYILADRNRWSCYHTVAWRNTNETWISSKLVKIIRNYERISNSNNSLFQTFPFFGVKPSLLDESGKEIVGPGEGYLVFSQPWPGMMRTIYNDHERFQDTYFTQFPGYYSTGDGKRSNATNFSIFIFNFTKLHFL